MNIPILGLDLAQDSGWAFWRDGMDKPKYGLIQLPRLNTLGDEIYRGHLALRVALEQLHEKFDLTGAGIAIEAAWVRHGNQNSDDPEDRRRDTERTILWLFGLATEAATTSHKLGADPRYFTRSQVLSHFCGTANLPKVRDHKGNLVSGSKHYSLLAAQSHGWKPKTHDVADALGLVCTAAAMWNVAVPWRNSKCAGPQYLDLVAAGKVVGGT